MSRRFNLDPRAPSRAPPPPPPKPAAPSAAPAPSAPASATTGSRFAAPPPATTGAPRAVTPPSTPGPAAAATSTAPTPARSRKRTMWIVAGVVGILLVGGAIAVFAATELTYPNKYVLDGNDMPSGMSNAQMTRSELDDAGMTKNPGPVDPEQFQEEYQTDSDAEKIHAQVLQDGRGARVVVLALKYADEDAARSAAASEGRAVCSFANGAALRDASVLIVIVPEGASSSAVGSVARALKEKLPELNQVCGPR